METIPLSHIFYIQRLKVPGINNFSRTKSLKSLLCFHILIVSHRLPKSHAFTQTTIFHYIFNRFFPIFLTDKLHPVIFYSMIIGNTVHFIHLAYPTDIVTDIRNYNHFNPKEPNPILKLAICEDNPSHYEIIHTILQKYPPGAFEITHFASGDEFLRKFTQLSGALLRYSLSGTESEADHHLYQHRNIYNKRKTDSSYRKNET